MEKHYNFNEVIALAWAHSNQGRNYVSVNHHEKVSTAQRVRNSLEYNTAEDPNYYHDKSIEAAKYDDQLIRDFVAANKKDKVNSRYHRRMQHILKKAAENGEVADHDLNMVVSLVWVYIAQERRENIERTLPDAPMNGFIGDTGDSLRGLPITVHAVYYWDDEYNTTRTILSGVTDHGRAIVWVASRMIDVIPRQQVVISRAVIKELNSHAGTDYTVLTQVHLAPGHEGGYVK